MIYKQQEPSEYLSRYIKMYWMIDSEGETTINQEKIIPDGYPEMIFHYKDQFESNLHGEWQSQEKYIIAGQIRNFFYLKNSGDVGMFAIKFQPCALTLLFDLPIDQYTDKVLSIPPELIERVSSIKEIAISDDAFESKVEAIELWFTDCIKQNQIALTNSEKAVDKIINTNGTMPIEKILKKCSVSERTFERFCKSHVGLSPKFFSRVIRNAHIFKLVNQANVDWSDISFQAGFYDQSHFIKNFKEFTGEEPSVYGFDSETMANFFLKNRE